MPKLESTGLLFGDVRWDDARTRFRTEEEDAEIAKETPGEKQWRELCEEIEARKVVKDLRRTYS